MFSHDVYIQTFISKPNLTPYIYILCFMHVFDASFGPSNTSYSVHFCSKAEKLDFNLTRWEYTRCASGAMGNIRNLEACQKEHMLRQAQALAQKDKAELEQHFTCYPFRHPAGEADFLSQFTELRPLKRRKFLVLDGPSNLGKSDYAKSLSAPSRTLDVNCASCDSEPPLRSYNPVDKDAILLDEASASLIVRNKKLMQGPAEPVELGSTQSNMYTYFVYVCKKKLIVSSNKWAEQLQELSESDRSWLEANQIYISVTEPLFIRPPGAVGGG